MAFTIPPGPPSMTSSSWQMNLILKTTSTAIPLRLPKLPHKPVRIAAFSANSPSSASKRAPIPARDSVIDFGKYKGKMLGSLPSLYLKWISKNLRARDTEEWAKLADEVLIDPVYRDRIEWEFAEKILSGNAASASSSGKGRETVSELLEISERFGWDNEDKRGWSRVDFGLLGTSKGGRIPRVTAAEGNKFEIGRLRGKEEIDGEEKLDEDRGRRKERRERLRRRRDGGTGCVYGGEWPGGREEVGGYRRGEEIVGEGDEDRLNPAVRSPFPGREALVKKVLNRRRSFL